MEELSRRDLLLTEEQIQKIANAKVAIFGLGGVGGYVFETLVRMGVNNFMICDGDTVSLSNINRQILALHSCVGEPKTEVAMKRAIDINPLINIDCHSYYFNPDTSVLFDFNDVDYVVDCIDSTNDKILLISMTRGIPTISSMGVGNRLKANFKISTIDKTNTDPLSKKMRVELRKLGISDLKVLYSDSKAINPYEGVNDNRKRVPGSISYVVGIAGLMIAEEVINDIIKL